VAFRQLAYLPDRRSTRIEQSAHLTVRGTDASRVPYQENVSTLSISCHGCRYLSRNKVLLGDIVTLEVVHFRTGGSKYATPARVRSVKQLAANEMLFDVAVELESPQDIWGIASPPEDWGEFSRLEASGIPARELQIVPRPATTRAPEPKPIPAEPARRFGSLETGSASPLPPFLAQLAANLRGEIGTIVLVTDRATANENTHESMSEFCSQIERKAMKVFEGLVRSFVEGLPKRLLEMNGPERSSAFNTHRRWPTNSSQK
jgi:hypothetical protein